MAVLDGLGEYRRLFCGESEAEKRRRFAKFKKEVETADNERRWRRDLERRRAKRAGRPGT
jgi:hypothetical protein